MDAARYARVRELFLAAEELPPDQQADFLRIQTGQDQSLFDDVRSLLEEHDPESARLEGERAAPVLPPPGAQLPVNRRRTGAKKDVADKTTRRGESKSSSLATQQNRRRGSEITQHGAQRTHASPRHGDSESPKSSATSPLWAKRTRESRRSNSRWLWLAALLPTALIGIWTFFQVQSTIKASVRNELAGVADSVSLATRRFLDDRAQLVESWSRQPSVRKAIEELVEAAKKDDSPEALGKLNESAIIKSQLQSLSGHEDVKFVIWNDSYITVASWRDDRADIGTPVHHTGAANLNRVMRGETVLYGPQRMSETDVAPEKVNDDRPVMAIIVPIRNDDNKIVASMAVRGFGLFDDFNQMFAESAAGGLDAYAVDQRGTMLSESQNAIRLAEIGALDVKPEMIAAGLRVADPGMPLTTENVQDVQRQIRPLTISVADATTGTDDVRIEEYNNYAGKPVVGAWRWNKDWQIGVVIERDAAIAFAPTRIVRFSFLLLGSVLSITAFAAAAKIASRSAKDHAAVHPLSRYELTGELGSGGMGVVYRARHRQLGRETALKVLRGDRHNKEDRLRFDREARLAASLSSPHSVMIYDYGRSEEGEAFCVMEFLHGLTLNEVVARGGHLPFGRVLFILSQVCDALSEAHGLNLLHRDIKPQNVMLSLDASVGDWAVVFDYGLAKPLQPDAGVYQTSETVWAGTPMYMAPERFREPSVMDPRSDIYSVGCVAYYLLSGRPPFIECDPESLFALIITQQPIGIATHRDGPVPPEINELVMRCMAKAADDRFESIAALSQLIDQLRTQYPWSVEEARDWWRKHGD